MPTTWHSITTRDGAHEVPQHWCEDCGAPAGFGDGVHMKAAKSKDDPRLGKWWCGYINSTPQCAAKHGERE